MSYRLFRLVEMHQLVDDELRLEQRRRWRDPFRITRLKKQKLRVKDLIHRCTLKPERA